MAFRANAILGVSSANRTIGHIDILIHESICCSDFDDIIVVYGTNCLDRVIFV